MRAVRRTADGAFIEELDVPPLAQHLELEPHPEGGWYRRTWASADTVATPAGDRPAGTLIVFLLPAGEASAWHRVASTEIWIGGGLGPVVIETGGSGETPQFEIAPNVWQRTLPAGHDALVSCLVSPGFDFADFSLAT